MVIIWRLIDWLIELSLGLEVKELCSFRIRIIFKQNHFTYRGDSYRYYNTGSVWTRRVIMMKMYSTLPISADVLYTSHICLFKRCSLESHLEHPFLWCSYPTTRKMQSAYSKPHRLSVLLFCLYSIYSNTIVIRILIWLLKLFSST